MPEDIFDFTDVSDLPEELQKKFAADGSVINSVYVDLLKEADRALTLTEVQAALYRKDGKMRSTTGVSSALSWLKKQGRVTHVNRTWSVPV